jgi:Restriction endonuclease NaeI
VRGNGGARSHLADEGIVILGGDYMWQRQIAVELDLPTPLGGEFVSVYVARATADWHGPVSKFGDGVWRPATRQTAQRAPSLSARIKPLT